ncbi:hypothetical protein [Legionella tunisiensis]|uniref:hypothetical protein n=1 Tax=Legionella tunisiensis TaxID=1034944 RepID=UPI0002D7048F|nr:hypothetical protein [Legionella tunisiensis]
MSKALIQQFRTALINYLKNPDDAGNQQALTRVSFTVYKDAIEKYGLEPDKYLAHMDTIIKSAVNGIKIHPHLGEILGSFKREISFADNPEECLAFHALNMALEMYLRNNFVNPEKIARDKLTLIDASIQQLKTGENPYIEELTSAFVKLKAIVDQHFALSPAIQVKESANFERKINLVCSMHKDAIESDAQVKSAFYSFLAMISSILVIIGVSLSDSFQRKSNFFKDVSSAPTKALSQPGFVAPFIEIQDSDDEQQKISSGLGSTNS